MTNITKTKLAQRRAIFRKDATMRRKAGLPKRQKADDYDAIGDRRTAPAPVVETESDMERARR